MSNQKVTKTFVRGSFLYLDDTGGYQQRQNLLESKQKVVEDKIGIYKYQQQLRQKVLQANIKKKQGQGNKIVEKPVLIPIRDTPVQPVPEPILDNQKCERAMQQQFDYFQTYISQKEKEKKFDQEQQRRISQFLQKQKKMKEKQMQNPPSETTLIVMQKQEPIQAQAKTKRILKMKIKKKNEEEKK